MGHIRYVEGGICHIATLYVKLCYLMKHCCERLERRESTSQQRPTDLLPVQREHPKCQPEQESASATAGKSGSRCTKPAISLTEIVEERAKVTILYHFLLYLFDSVNLAHYTTRFGRTSFSLLRTRSAEDQSAQPCPRLRDQVARRIDLQVGSKKALRLLARTCTTCLPEHVLAITSRRIIINYEQRRTAHDAVNFIGV